MTEMKKFNILVVDDEQEFREMTVKQLLHRGMEAEGAEDGKIGLEMVEEGNFDVVLLDVKMPVMDGIKALRKMKQAKPLVEVVLLTGHASVDSGIEGMKLGAFDYLMKPMEFDEVLEKLCDAFEKRRIHLDKIEMAQMKKHMSLPS
ncbi:response regulator [Desulforhopalus vacuolatus]|uniref:response regulator n=1 Tax=Desulforhopalus vacuolatus TaxID=40414 RepID=UPI001F05DFF0|nr:response regulator [Desulforhopalus vacuolatus]